MTQKDLTEDILGLIVHSYNNYLSGAMGFNELAKLDCEDRALSEKLDLSIASSKEAVDFGDQLLASIARLQVHLEEIEVRELLNQVVNKVILEKKISPDIDLHTIKTEPKWFIRSISSLVDFIRQYSPKSQIELRADINSQEDEVSVTIQVSDLKFTPAHKERLFEPFYTSRHLLGTKDVGIAVASGFIEQMNGALTWEDDKGFVVRLTQISNAE